MKKVSAWFIISIIILTILDLLTKKWATVSLANPIDVIPNILRFFLQVNTGGIFGIGEKYPMLFTILSGLAILLLSTYYIMTHHQYSKTFDVSMVLILGGALGNFIDRFVSFILPNGRLDKGVIDFIDMYWGFCDITLNCHWPNYNLADAFVSIGFFLLVVAFIKVEMKIRNEAKVEAIKEEDEIES